MKKFYRIEHDGAPRHAVEEGGRWRLLEGDLFGRHETGDEIASTGHRLLAPVTPSKMVCIGLNYKDHAAEQNKPLPEWPLMFIKPSTAAIGPGDTIVIPPGIGRVDHEAEVGVVIGRRATKVSERDAHQYVFGLICFNDVSARGLQQKGYQYTHAKGFDTFAPLGPCIAAGVDHRGSAGIGRLTDIGPDPLRTALFVAAEVGIGVVIGYAAGPWLERQQKLREADLEPASL